MAPLQTEGPPNARVNLVVAHDEVTLFTYVYVYTIQDGYNDAYLSF